MHGRVIPVKLVCTVVGLVKVKKSKLVLGLHMSSRIMLYKYLVLNSHSVQMR